MAHLPSNANSSFFCFVFWFAADRDITPPPMRLGVRLGEAIVPAVRLGEAIGPAESERTSAAIIYSVVPQAEEASGLKKSGAAETTK